MVLEVRPLSSLEERARLKAREEKEGGTEEEGAQEKDSARERGRSSDWTGTAERGEVEREFFGVRN